MLSDQIRQLPLIDHHAHGITLSELDRPGFEACLTESSYPPPEGATNFQKPVGLNIRRYCAPVLDLPACVEPETYVEQRLKLGVTQTSQRLMKASDLDTILVDTYDRARQDLTTPQALGRIADSQAFEILRIESIFENVAKSGPDSSTLLARFCDELEALSAHAVGFKSILSYRTTFMIDTARPALGEVRASLDRWLSKCDSSGIYRLDDPVISRYVLWATAELARDRRLPIQFHVGIGDDDILMYGNDPSYFTGFIAEMQSWRVDIALLHCYPFIRTAQWLAEVFQNVYYDIGFMLNFSGPSIRSIFREAFEIGPFFKQLYSSDAYAIPEFYYVSSFLFRQNLVDMVSEWVSEDYCSEQDALGICKAVCFENAARIYGLPRTTSS